MKPGMRPGMKPGMKPVQLDFARPSLARGWWRASPAWRLALAAAMLLCLGAAWHALGLAQQARQHEREQATAARHRPAPPAPPPVVAVDPGQVAAVNAVVTQLNLPWRDLQAAVAAAASPQVGLLALEPDVRKQVLRIRAEARSPDDMLRYVERLQQQPRFRSVLLRRHDLADPAGGEPLRFELDASWESP